MVGALKANVLATRSKKVVTNFITSGKSVKLGPSGSSGFIFNFFFPFNLLHKNKFRGLVCVYMCVHVRPINNSLKLFKFRVAP